MEILFADVIVNKTSYEVDKPFKYAVPKELETQVQVGSRVLVPFGKGNQNIEGYVINIDKITPSFTMKNISLVVDQYPLLNNKSIELIKWMKDQYMCSYLECIKCFIPGGISIKPIKYISLKQDIDEYSIKDEKYIKILKYLKHKPETTYEEIFDVLGKDVRNALKKLLLEGIIQEEIKFTSTVKDKTMKVAALNLNISDAMDYLENLSHNNSAQKRILNILIDNEFIAVNDLVRFANVSYNTINSLHKKGIINIEEIIVNREPFNAIINKTSPLELTTEQKFALEKIIDSINGKNNNILLHGITGSGKTEIYLQSIEYLLSKDMQAIVLVPEISLTPQMVERFKSRFGDKVAIIHSRLSLGERYDEWKKIKEHKVDIVIGARSAVFSPLEKLKLIIIDEEHETSYQSENKPRYNAKDIALKRAELENAVVVLGSATPSLETYYNALNGKYELIKLEKRVNQSKLPKVEVVDMRKELEEGNRSIFSKKLYDEISKNIENNQQTILFLNRRGYSTFVSCRSCGYVMKCPDCSISLTYHSFNNSLACHYCGFERRNVVECPSCKSKYIKYFGIGTQKIEEEVQKLFNNASVIRMDFDTTGTKMAHQRILDNFKNNNINILIGTQMIAKGHDFPNVTLVGIISADTSLNIDDFKASERTFQLLTQVAGRAGRAQKEGRVIIQSYQPDNYSIQFSKNHDYQSFYDQEILIRNSLEYPPFTDLVSIIISNNDNNVSKCIAIDIEDALSSRLKSISDIKYTLLKPTPAPIYKIKQLFRWRIILKINDVTKVKEILKELEAKYYDKTNITIEINPINML